MSGLIHERLAAHFGSDAIFFDRSDISPGDPAIHAALGWAYALTGDPEAAVRAGERAVELLPEQARHLAWREPDRPPVCRSGRPSNGYRNTPWPVSGPYGVCCGVSCHGELWAS